MFSLASSLDFFLCVCEFFLLFSLIFIFMKRTFYLLTEVGERKPDNPKENVLNFAILAVPHELTRYMPYSDHDPI